MISLKTNAVDQLKSITGMILQDLNALPEEGFSRSFGDATRTIADVIHEVNLVNDHIGMVVRGEKPFDWPSGSWVKAPEDLQTKDAVIRGFTASSNRIIETYEAFSEEDIEGFVDTTHGPRTRFQRCQFMAQHMWYHSGQINYVQTLLGDTEWHW
jgi:uncharacterized damage-inducible protein DinB